MGIVKAFSGALGGTFADQWKEIITAGPFNEYTVVAPGLYQRTNNGRGVNSKGSVDVISSGSKIFVPENSAAFIFSQAGIEDIITEAGGYEYTSGQATVFQGGGFKEAIARQTAGRFGYGGQTSDQKHIAFINLREIRGIKFGTRGPVVYHDRFYGADLEIVAFGTFSLRVVDPVAFVRNFLPPNTRSYAFDTVGSRQQIAAEFIQAFVVAVTSLSATHRISELLSQAGVISDSIADNEATLGSWIARYGLDVVQVGIEGMEFSPDSRELVRKYTEKKMSVSAFEGASQRASNMAAQQQIAGGVQNHGLGDGGGMLLGMNIAQAMNPQVATPAAQGSGMSFDQQVEAVKKLKDLLDAGILSQDEFDAKKKEVMGL